ncbi:MAG TPA: hypothetical protein VHZ96_15850 [Frankiaceae bacterium]|jgi:hypothetical protein|nr:hypothetical protein [Frankiaceae bacterium]
MTTTLEPFTLSVWVCISGRPTWETAVTQAPSAPRGGGMVGVGLGVGLGLTLGLAEAAGEPLGGGAAEFAPEPLEHAATSAPSATTGTSARARDGLLIASGL